MRILTAALALSVLLAGCGRASPPDAPADRAAGRPPASKAETFLPRLTDAHLPRLLAGLVPGTSTAADVRSRFPELEMSKDKSLGGKIFVAYNGRPAILLRLPPRGNGDARRDGVEALSFYLVPDEAGVPRVWSMRLVQDPQGGRTLCAWLHEAVGSDPAALVCAGDNRSLGRGGKSADGGVYCIGTPDGTQGILVECRTTSRGFGEIEYDLLGSRR